MEYNSDFRHDLKVGKLKGETAFHKMIEDKKIEVKYDRKTKETLNVYIEYQSRGKPSGIRTTEADVYAYYVEDEVCLTIPTKKLKEKILELNPRRVPGGDSNSSMGFLIPLTELIKENNE